MPKGHQPLVPSDQPNAKRSPAPYSLWSVWYQKVISPMFALINCSPCIIIIIDYQDAKRSLAPLITSDQPDASPMFPLISQMTKDHQRLVPYVSTLCPLWSTISQRSPASDQGDAKRSPALWSLSKYLTVMKPTCCAEIYQLLIRPTIEMLKNGMSTCTPTGSKLLMYLFMFLQILYKN